MTPVPHHPVPLHAISCRRRCSHERPARLRHLCLCGPLAGTTTRCTAFSACPPPSATPPHFLSVTRCASTPSKCCWGGASEHAPGQFCCATFRGSLHLCLATIDTSMFTVSHGHKRINTLIENSIRGGPLLLHAGGRRVAPAPRAAWQSFAPCAGCVANCLHSLFRAPASTLRAPQALLHAGQTWWWRGLVRPPRLLAVAPLRHALLVIFL